MKKNTNLKAFVRYDYTGRVVPGSMVFRNKKPVNGYWKQLIEPSVYTCCNYTESCVSVEINVTSGDDPFNIQFYSNEITGFTATINWGDNSTDTVIVPVSNSQVILHTYLSAEIFTVTVCIDNPQGLVSLFFNQDIL